jgi:hypothetical protein
VATDLTPLKSPPLEVVPPPEEPPRRKIWKLGRPQLARLRPSRAYGGRMLLVYALLVLAVGGGIAAAVLVPEAKHKAGPSINLGPWSSWRPLESSTARTSDIGVHVGATYHGANGSEYTYVVAEPPQWEGGSIVATVISGEVGSPDILTPTPDSNTAMFTLCGPQQQCTLDHAPSRNDLIYLRREALELALYTFHYVPVVANVIVLLPRLDSNGTPYVLFWRRFELAKALQQPLGETLAERPPALGKVPKAEQDVLHDLVDPRLYRARPLTALDGSVVFALVRVPLAG